jgi:hypothetical protein
MSKNKMIALTRPPLAEGGSLQGFNSKQVQLRGNPLEFNRFRGTVGQAGDTPLAKLRAYYYFVEQIKFPMTPDEFDSKFAADLPLFVDNPQSCPGRQTNASFAASTNETFVMLGATIVMSGKGFGFSQPGAMVPAPTDAGTAVPVIEGCPETGQRDAVLDYGGSHWRFVDAFSKAYRLQMAACRRFLFLDESIEDIGIMSAAEHNGTGHALINTMPFIRETNDILTEKGCAQRFLPYSHAGTECLGAPTAEVIYGNESIRGASDSRVFLLNQPMVYTCGMRLDVQFSRVENDCCFLDDMRRASVLDCGTPTLPDALYADSYAGGAGGFPGVYNIPAGCFSFGIVLLGYALTNAACLDFACCLAPGSVGAQMYSGNAFIGELRRQANNDPQLRQVLAGHKPEAINHLNAMLSGPPPG